MVYKIAVSSTDGKIVNQHFGKSKAFLIVQVDDQTGQYEYLENREVDPVCHGRDHDDVELEQVIARLNDCRYVLVSKIGLAARNALESAGIGAFEIPGILQESIAQLLGYLELQSLFQ